jgi:hypothetical protein
MVDLAKLLVRFCRVTYDKPLISLELSQTPTTAKLRVLISTTTDPSAESDNKLQLFQHFSRLGDAHVEKIHYAYKIVVPSQTRSQQNASSPNASMCFAMKTTGKNKKEIVYINNTSQHPPSSNLSLLFRIKVRVRSQANNHNKEAISSQRQTRLAEHIPPPLAALHLGAPSRMPRALSICRRVGLVIV